MRTPARPLLLLLLLAGAAVGCGDKSVGGLDDTAAEGGGAGEGSDQVDADADGYPADFDCDDDDPAIFPSAPELCNGVDDNCDGRADEGLPDIDADGTPDCLDEEACDGIDNDGDGLVDEDQPDADLDGTPDCADVEACDGIDNNGDGVVDEGFDNDGDGFTPCSDTLGEWDCDDDDDARSPDAREVAGDDIDNDCDLVIDPERWDGQTIVITEILNNPGYVRDSLGEWIELYNPGDVALYVNGLLIDTGTSSYRVEAEAPVVIEAGGYLVVGASTDIRENGGAEVDHAWSEVLLENEAGAVSVRFDGALRDEVLWDPTGGWILLDGASLSFDPSLLVDLAASDAANDPPEAWCAGTETLGRSLDLATPGQPNPPCPAVDRDGDGFLNDVDCDDRDIDVNPGAAEVAYDGVDNDCDPLSPDDDVDGDGAGIATDCDDNDSLRRPGNPEVPYDGVDNDCDAATPDDDLDGDGSLGAVDCDDNEPLNAPGFAEVCDGVDNDCDGMIDGDDPSLSSPC